ncbi:MAG: acylphosphatase [Sphingobacteriales bacterium]|nr:acylphosphatase [Sphingobacteriales bacterium]OJY92057.1 MAG: hypothetical protein BGP14_22670 [Sphingobacteriales bacterium 44-15]
MIVSKRAVIAGKVQGVFYRASTKERAIALGVNGEVWNRTDGGVELVAEGEEEQVNALLEWCRLGPPRAEVKELQVSDSTVKGFKNFTVKRF